MATRDIGAAADAVAELAVGNQEARREAVDIIRDLSRSDGAAERDAVVRIGKAAASDPRNTAGITAVFREAAQDREVLVKMDLPQEVITGETEPTVGEQGWQSTASSLGVEQILTRFSSDQPTARIDVEEIHELPAGAPALSEGLVVNSLFLLTPENFQSQDVVANHIRFSVEKGWLEENSIHPWSVQFNRFDDDRGIWDPLLGKPVGEDEERLYYMVSPPGMSLWAITGASEVPPDRFRADHLDIKPTHADVGRDFQIQAHVTNLTSEAVVWNGVLWLNGQVHATQSLDVGTGAPETVTFSVRLDPGTYTVRIEKLLGGLTVEAPPLQALGPAMPAVPTPTPAAVQVPKPTPAAVQVQTATQVPIQVPKLTPAAVQVPTATPAAVQVATATPAPARMPTTKPTPFADATPVPTEVPPAGTPPPAAGFPVGRTVGIAFGITAALAVVSMYLWRTRRVTRRR